jgi:hypothetical protein
MYRVWGVNAHAIVTDSVCPQGGNQNQGNFHEWVGPNGAFNPNINSNSIKEIDECFSNGNSYVLTATAASGSSKLFFDNPYDENGTPIIMPGAAITGTNIPAGTVISQSGTVGTISAAAGGSAVTTGALSHQSVTVTNPQAVNHTTLRSPTIAAGPPMTVPQGAAIDVLSGSINFRPLGAANTLQEGYSSSYLKWFGNEYNSTLGVGIVSEWDMQLSTYTGASTPNTETLEIDYLGNGIAPAGSLTSVAALTLADKTTATSSLNVPIPQMTWKSSVWNGTAQQTHLYNAFETISNNGYPFDSTFYFSVNSPAVNKHWKFNNFTDVLANKYIASTSLGVTNNTYTTTIALLSGLTGNYTISLPNVTANDTFATLGASQTFAGTQTFNNVTVSGTCTGCSNATIYRTWTPQVATSSITSTSQISADWYPPVAQTLDRFTILVNVAPVGCATFPVISVWDQSLSTPITSLTVNAGGEFDSGSTSLALSIPAGHLIRIRTSTAPVTCSTNATLIGVTVIYH